jgi:hypothetical protein
MTVLDPPRSVAQDRAKPAQARDPAASGKRSGPNLGPILARSWAWAWAWSWGMLRISHGLGRSLDQVLGLGRWCKRWQNGY